MLGLFQRPGLSRPSDLSQSSSPSQFRDFLRSFGFFQSLSLFLSRDFSRLQSLLQPCNLSRSRNFSQLPHLRQPHSLFCARRFFAPLLFARTHMLRKMIQQRCDLLRLQHPRNRFIRFHCHGIHLHTAASSVQQPALAQTVHRRLTRTTTSAHPDHTPPPHPYNNQRSPRPHTIHMASVNLPVSRASFSAALAHAARAAPTNLLASWPPSTPHSLALPAPHPHHQPSPPHLPPSSQPSFTPTDRLANVHMNINLTYPASHCKCKK